jgi:hypothetical protein
LYNHFKLIFTIDINTSSITNNYSLFSINEISGTYKLSNKFPINQPINGTYTFNFLSPLTNTTNLMNVSLAMQLSFILEFIKYNYYIILSLYKINNEKVSAISVSIN